MTRRVLWVALLADASFVAHEVSIAAEQRTRIAEFFDTDLRKAGAK